MANDVFCKFIQANDHITNNNFYIKFAISVDIICLNPKYFICDSEDNNNKPIG